jgi:hypothetical protein
VDRGVSREEAYKILRTAAGETVPKQGDSLVLTRRGRFEFIPFALMPVKTVTAAYSIEGKDVCVLGDATIAPFAVTLPPTAFAEFRVLVVKKVDSGGSAVTVTADGSEKIDAASTYPLSSQWDSVMIVSDGSAWYII